MLILNFSIDLNLKNYDYIVEVNIKLGITMAQNNNLLLHLANY